MSSPVELIKERLDIADIIGSYVKLEKAGANLKAKCPFHNERTPSFFVSPARGSYYCFGCGAKGDMFSFVQAFEGVDFMGALRTLASRAGIEVIPENPRIRSEREQLLSLLETTTLFFEQRLQDTPVALAYLRKRGLTDETIHSWRIGFAPDEWHAADSYLQTKGFMPPALEKAGITKTEGGKTYDRFRNRLMFPIFDASGRAVAFSGRILGKEGEHTPKYLNSPETPVFSKSGVLYGFDRAKQEIRRKDYAMLVEGQMDLLMCHQAGFKNAVASSGTAFTDGQVTLLKRLSKRLLMVYDADKAGVQASLRSSSLALSAGMEVKVAALPVGTDPAELIARDPKQFATCLKSSMHIVDFYLEVILREKLEARALARAIKDRLLPYVAALESSIERDHFISRIASRTGMRGEAIREDLQHIAAPKRNAEPVPSLEESVLSPRRNLAERLLVGLVLWQESVRDSKFDTSAIRKQLGTIAGSDRAETLFTEAKEIADELMYQAESYYRESSLKDAAEELLTTLEEDTLKEQLALVMKELTHAEASKQTAVKLKLLARYQEVSRRLNEIRGSRSV